LESFCDQKEELFLRIQNLPEIQIINKSLRPENRVQESKLEQQRAIQ
jgi:hypothetical protein